jgi:hypothetical protein
MSDETTDEICMPSGNAEPDFGSAQNKAINDYFPEILVIVCLQKDHWQ